MHNIRDLRFGDILLNVVRGAVPNTVAWRIKGAGFDFGSMARLANCGIPGLGISVSGVLRTSLASFQSSPVRRRRLTR